MIVFLALLFKPACLHLGVEEKLTHVNADDGNGAEEEEADKHKCSAYKA